MHHKPLTLVTAVLLLSVPLVGCLGDEVPSSGDDEDAAQAQSIDRDSVHVPQDAELEEVDDGYRLLWTDAELPLEQTVTIPAGATLVNATVVTDGEQRAWVNATSADSGLSRCGDAEVDGFDQAASGAVSCTGLTALDELPAEWELAVEANATVADEIRLDLLSVPLDGPVGELDLAELSAPVHELAPVEQVSIPSHDDVPLFAEVHRPDVSQPVPTILVSHIAAEADASGDLPEDAPDLGPDLDTDAFAEEMAARGYAVVTAHVRGTGQSGGCLDVHGPLEQADQAELVGWIAEQEFSSDAIGTYGIGYSASTALEASMSASDQVDATVALSAVTDAYRDWHFGGVPNGEGTADPLTGQLAGALGYVGAEDKASRLAGSGPGCDGESFTGAMDPRAVYDAFYEARNLTSMAEDLQAPTMYTQGLYDRASKPSMADGLVDKLPEGSYSMVGPWSDGLPSRPDATTMIVAWMDAHLKDKDVGLEQLPATSVSNAADLYHVPAEWPPAQPDPTTLYPNFDEGTLQNSSVEGSASVLLEPIGAAATAQQDDEVLIRLEGEIAETTVLSGPPQVDLAVTLNGLDNAFVSAQLYEEDDEGERELVTFGMANLAHREGHDAYTPVEPGQLTEMALEMQPTERVLEGGDTLVLEIRSSTVDDWTLVQPGKPGQLVVEGGAEGTALVFETVAEAELGPAPTTVTG